MKLPWKSASDSAAESSENAENDTASTSPESTAAASDSADADARKAAKGAKTTPGKGRPTPKRREAEGRRRGPAAPPPMTRAEARARKKQLKKEIKATTTKEERKAARAEIRAKRREQQAAMMDGDERYMRKADKGPERRLIRDIVDSRRHLAGLFMPFAMLMVFSMFLGTLADLILLFMLVYIAIIILEGYLDGRRIARRVRERYPNTELGGWTIGWYAFRRAMTLRSMRAPKPKVGYGDDV